MNMHVTTQNDTVVAHLKFVVTMKFLVFEHAQ